MSRSTPLANDQQFSKHSSTQSALILCLDAKDDRPNMDEERCGRNGSEMKWHIQPGNSIFIINCFGLLDFFLQTLNSLVMLIDIKIK
jgi:hypothetical protein